MIAPIIVWAAIATASGLAVWVGVGATEQTYHTVTEDSITPELQAEVNRVHHDLRQANGFELHGSMQMFVALANIIKSSLGGSKGNQNSCQNYAEQFANRWNALPEDQRGGYTGRTNWVTSGSHVYVMLERKDENGQVTGHIMIDPYFRRDQ